MIAYKAGQVLLVTTRCANAAIARGVAEKVKKPDGDGRRSASAGDNNPPEG